MPSLLTLDADYTLTTIRNRHLEHELLCTDLDGFFRHVWTVHPLVGADPDEPRETAVGPPTRTELSDRHTVIEGTVALSPRLERLPPLNFVLAQALLLWRLHRLVKDEEVSVIRVGDPYYQALLGYLLSRVHRLPLVIRVNGNYDASFESSGAMAYPRIFRKRWVEKRVERFLLPRADLIAAGNQNNLDYAVANGAREERCTLFRIGNIIDPVHFLHPGKRGAVGPELGIDDRPFLVCVSRLEAVKHPEDVVRAFALAQKSDPRLALVMVGEGTMRSELEQLAKDLALQDDVIFAGARSQPWIADALASAAVIVSPVTGRALVEAALSGTPIVAYDYEWQSELLQSGENAVLVPYRDVAGMAEAVSALLDDPSRAATFGARARSSTLDMMDPDRLKQHERDQYGRILGLSPA